MENGKPKHDVIIIIEWHEHDSLKAIDQHVEDEFSSGEYHSYINIAYGAKHMADYKYTATKWAKDRIEKLNQLIGLIEQLPDDMVYEYEVSA